VTLADVWFEPAHDRIYGAADTRIARGPGNVLTEHGPKLLPINILCKQPGPSGFVDRPAYTTTVGFAYAGSTLSALATHALANTLLQNLAGPDGVPPPGVHHVAFSIGDVACRYMREVCQLSGTSGLFSAIVFGFCANTNKFRAFTLTPVLDPRPIRVRVTERDLYVPEALVVIGSCPELLRERVCMLRKARPEYPIELPRRALQEIISEGADETVGGTVQYGHATRFGFAPISSMVPINPPLESGRNATLTVLGHDLMNIAPVGSYVVSVDGR
jgi:hypothetical protein